MEPGRSPAGAGQDFPDDIIMAGGWPHPAAGWSDTRINNLLQALYGWFTERVWETDLRRLPGPARGMLFIVRILHMLFRE